MHTFDPKTPFLKIYPEKIPVNVADLFVSMSMTYFLQLSGKFLKISTNKKMVR